MRNSIVSRVEPDESLSPDTYVHHSLQPAAPAAQLLGPAYHKYMLRTEKQQSLGSRLFSCLLQELQGNDLIE